MRKYVVLDMPWCHSEHNGIVPFWKTVSCTAGMMRIQVNRPCNSLYYNVPCSERKTMLQYCHDVETAEHFRVTKTLARVRQKYCWPGMQADTRVYIAGCEKCAKRKSSQMKKREPMKLLKNGITMDRIATDILGELPMTEQDNRYILVISLLY